MHEKTKSHGESSLVFGQLMAINCMAWINRLKWRPDFGLQTVEKNSGSVEDNRPDAEQGDTKITFVLTSCGRQDLLETTLDSFLKFNTSPIFQYIVIEDSGIAGANDRLKAKYSDHHFTWIENPTRIGQVRSIERAYAKVRTQWVFHCEDDWEFYAPGFLEKSMAILETAPPILQVWLRADGDTNGHPVGKAVFAAEKSGVLAQYRVVEEGFRDVWSGFSFNPGLRRMIDYRLIGGYVKYGDEAGVSKEYGRRCYRAAMLLREDGNSGYVRHLGWTRHVGLD